MQVPATVLQLPLQHWLTLSQTHTDSSCQLYGMWLLVCTVVPLGYRSEKGLFVLCQVLSSRLYRVGKRCSLGEVEPRVSVADDHSCGDPGTAILAHLTSQLKPSCQPTWCSTRCKPHTDNKIKNKLDFSQIKNFCTKDTIKRVKGQPVEWENICK